MNEMTMSAIPSRRRGWAALLVGILAATVGFSLVAPAAEAAAAPQYKVEAVKFQANKTSPYDPWYAPSNEVYWVFNSVGADGTASGRASRVFGSVDKGEIRYFSGNEACVYRASCAGGAAGNGIGVSIQAWEKDMGSVAETLKRTTSAFTSVASMLTKANAWLNPSYLSKWSTKLTSMVGSVCRTLADLIANEDDLIGTQIFAYSPTTLSSRLRSVGASFVETRYFGGTNYSLTLRVSRVA